MGSGSSTQVVQNKMPKFQQRFLQNELLPFARDISQQPFEAYGGQFTADVSPLSMGTQTQFQQVADIANMTPEDYAAMTQANYNPFQDQVIDAALARAQRERDIARTGEMADITRAGAFGNERRGVFEAERQAAFDLGQQEMVANLMQQGYSQAQAQTMAQLGMGQQAALAGAQGMMQLGNLEQLTQQAELDALYNEFMREQNLPLQQLGARATAASGIPGGYGTTTQTQSGSPGFSGILGAIGAAGQGLGAMGVTGKGIMAALPFLSDRRLKRNIRKVGERDGVNFYRWEWTDAAQNMGVASHPTEGVIAQELAEVHPDLVHSGQDGYLRVDYAGLQERLA